MRLLLFALAEKLGIWDVDALGDVIPSDLLMEWGGYRKAKSDLERQELDKLAPSKGR